MAARTDKITDPVLAARILQTRRGQAYFSRFLNNLRDDEFTETSLLPGWSRAHVIAHVGLNARALTRLLEWANTGVETPMYASTTQRNEEIEFAATLPPQALRNLSDHAAIHLNVEWRDLPEDRWAYEVKTAQGRTVPVSETIWMRGREVWIHAVDLNNGARFEDIPEEVTDGLLTDIVGAWQRRREAEGLPGFVLEATDRDARWGTPTGESVVVRGTAAQLAEWASGRGNRVLTSDGQSVQAPRWL